MESGRKYWFRAKRYGWGWTPCTWQGWAAIAAWAIVFIAAVAGSSAAGSARFLPIGAAIIMTLVLVAVIRVKGEPSRWRWGK